MEEITIERDTKETQISLKLNLYGEGKSRIDTGIGFFNHMLEAFSKHALIDMELSCKGDLFVDFHHSVEDCGIVIGQGLHRAIFPVGGIERFGNGAVVMDEANVECDIDISNRAFLLQDMSAAAGGFSGKVGDFDVELVEEFFRALVINAGFSVHLVLKRGKNLHHIIEASFKAFALALRRAVAVNPRVKMPSTKGCL
ncbi:imidazoleglycerol-phosphate dehydratase HisB [Helicobacter saguini]|uniref:Imidazoleglycerol-phosphate dehydratase n=1 Tax=Helicobacter saguini TaxID=1548018 RepID=A0A347VPE7_9HELI|nr:imidazoleglycerol-phosphate dehydratase HisB [Helicobacter saguini]MWV61394.1 imidazoleglycerol-phosphate dehydratase HisB [Helicobacter saguini]MWV67938.1 imidazoleglycerol-phosphate dehydratase HisB [Helicobacter saguini]MWV70595.1 imidazoleglycerol-phosphate dehydratase HisB [Helicobacter saguini]MWV72499.1 imidazoleglycerol-phosphate dehydratase HisB [Helicobacter saguini]TLD94755.1 imidazoleglycerol-phosphate dehydratase HisB [Helicobacter saguini]